MRSPRQTKNIISKNCSQKGVTILIIRLLHNPLYGNLVADSPTSTGKLVADLSNTDNMVATYIIMTNWSNW